MYAPNGTVGATKKRFSLVGIGVRPIRLDAKKLAFTIDCLWPGPGGCERPLRGCSTRKAEAWLSDSFGEIRRAAEGRQAPVRKRGSSTAVRSKADGRAGNVSHRSHGYGSSAARRSRSAIIRCWPPEHCGRHAVLGDIAQRLCSAFLTAKAACLAGKRASTTVGDFWGTDLFKTVQDSVERVGTDGHKPLVNQILIGGQF